MEFSTALAADLRLLINSIDLDERRFVAALDSVIDHANVAVPSFVGLRLLVVNDQSPVQLAVFEPSAGRDRIASSIKIPLSTMGTIEPESFITLYATNAGAFIDLAADISYALGLPDPALTPTTLDPTKIDGTVHPDRPDKPDRPDQHDRPQEPDHTEHPTRSLAQIVVDDDLRPDTTSPVVSGLTDATVINQAIGALIAGGHDPDDAHGELDRRALGVGLTKAGFAAWYVETLLDPNSTH